jgi:hypothetical protein
MRGAAVNSYAAPDGIYVFARRDLGPARAAGTAD